MGVQNYHVHFTGNKRVDKYISKACNMHVCVAIANVNKFAHTQCSLEILLNSGILFGCI